MSGPRQESGGVSSCGSLPAGPPCGLDSPCDHDTQMHRGDQGGQRQIPKVASVARERSDRGALLHTTVTPTATQPRRHACSRRVAQGAQRLSRHAAPQLACRSRAPHTASHRNCRRRTYEVSTAVLVCGCAGRLHRQAAAAPTETTDADQHAVRQLARHRAAREGCTESRGQGCCAAAQGDRRRNALNQSREARNRAPTPRFSVDGTDNPHKCSACRRALCAAKTAAATATAFAPARSANARPMSAAHTRWRSD